MSTSYHPQPRQALRSVEAILNQSLRNRLLIAFLALLGSIAPFCSQPAAAASPSGPERRPAELLILLSSVSGAPTPEGVLAAFNQHLPLPGVLGNVSPVTVRFLLSYRATGETLEWLKTHPESPRALLEWFLVLSYPTVVDVEAVRKNIAASPHVRHAEVEQFFSHAATPNDTLFAGTDPLQSQWGAAALNLPAAWDKVKGSAYIGLVDGGVQANHPDLQAFSSNGLFLGGNFRPHLSWDLTNGSPNADELPNGLGGFAGHGTHVAGIIAGTTNNNRGIAGTCWNCSLLVGKWTSFDVVSGQWIMAAITWVVDHGAQVINASLGSAASANPCSPPPGFSPPALCLALDFAEERGVLVVAASGNEKRDINFPASDPRVLAVGGIQHRPTGPIFWDEGTTGGSPINFGSNYTKTPGTKMQDLVAPARDVLSSVYTGYQWNPSVPCGDGSTADGYGLCSGTSMATPFVSGIAGLIRSVNPLLSRAQVRQFVIDTASRNGVWDSKLGYGYPNAAAAVDRALGKAGGLVLKNRLTPLFSLYSSSGTDSFYTIAPQMAGAALFGQVDETCVRNRPSDVCSTSIPYLSVGPTVASYTQFPGFSPCFLSTCPTGPSASLFVFTTPNAPYSGAPPLVPLYRLSYNPRRLNPASSDPNRDVTYTTDSTALASFRSVGYELDGLEGFIFKRCVPEPQCIPTGAVRVYRLYSSSRDDFAIFPESELSQKIAEGYASTPGLNDWIGYAYPNLDTDHDSLIDGFEGLIGTSPSNPNSDSDGCNDAEILRFPYSDPLVGGPCT